MFKGEKLTPKSVGLALQFLSSLFTYQERNWNMAGFSPGNSMYRLLKEDHSSVGRLLMMLEFRLWVRATL